MAFTFWKFKWANYPNDPAVTFVKQPGTGYYTGYSATGAFRGSYLNTEDAATTSASSASSASATPMAPAAPEPVNQKFAGWGRVIPISMGQRRMSPQIIWLRHPIVLPDAVGTALYANETVPMFVQWSATMADMTLDQRLGV